MSPIIVIFISFTATYATLFKRKNVSFIYDKILCFDQISTNHKK